MAPAALPATAVFEFRTTGAATNGGIFDSASAGTDYSQQDAAQLALKDCACTTGGTTLTSATGGFTAAMVGNWCYLSGTHFTTGRYKIVAYTDTNTVTLCADPTDGSDASSGTCNVGGAIDLPTDAIFELAVSGNFMYVKAGTYTFTESIAVSSSVKPTAVIGYNTTRGDDPTGTDRPLFACGAYSFSANASWRVFNLRFTGTATVVCDMYSAQTSCVNCYIYNSSGFSNRAALKSCENVVDTELVSTKGYCYAGSGAFPMFFACYLHDSVRGISQETDNYLSVHSIFDTLSNYGIYKGHRSRHRILNNTFYGGGTCIHGSNTGHAILNNIIDTWTLGLYNSNTIPKYGLMICGYNNFHGNTNDRSAGLAAMPGDTTGDPDFVNAGGGDFSLDTATDCDDTGFGIRLGVG